MPKQTVKEKTENKKGVPTNENETRARARVSDVDVWCRYDEAVDITELVENPRNPNKHPDKQIAMLAKIIKSQGWRQPITVSKRSGFIVKGHGRLQAAKVLNVENVPVEFQDYATEADEYADLIADNRIAELAEPDALMIDELLKDAMFEDFDLELTGFDGSKHAYDILDEVERIQNDSDLKPEYPIATELMEAHNYIVLYFDNEIDWKAAQSKLSIQTEQKPDGRHAGIGRVIRGQPVIDKIMEVS